MKEQFVTYEIASALKELGFDEECLAKYDSFGELLTSGCYYNSHPIHLAITQNDICEAHILVPLWQQVIDWLREEKHLHITITSQSQESWQWHIQYPHDPLGKLWEEDFATYYKAREESILKAIEICKEIK